jgi:ABC-type arginine transport system ATPase subunit
MELLATLKLSDQANSVTRSMAYGKQRLVEIALALATKPRICCWMNRRPAFRRLRARSCSKCWRSCRAM